MSIRQMVKVWGLQVSQSWQLVLLALADHADDAGRSVRPSLAYLAWKTSLSARQIRRIITSLRARGVLVVVRPAAQHRPVEYRLHLEVLPMKPHFHSTDKMSALDGRPGRTFRGARADTGGARPDIAMTTEPSFEPSVTEPGSFSEEEQGRRLKAKYSGRPGEMIKDLARPKAIAGGRPA